MILLQIRSDIEQNTPMRFDRQSSWSVLSMGNLEQMYAANVVVTESKHLLDFCILLPVFMY